jgi:hypothetical protein
MHSKSPKTLSQIHIAAELVLVLPVSFSLFNTLPITGLRFQENLDCARYPEGDRPAMRGVFH